VADEGTRTVRGCLSGLALVFAAFWAPVVLAVLAWRAWPWSGTVWLIVVAVSLAAWPVWELIAHWRRR
jgi:hypothetical protein